MKKEFSNLELVTLAVYMLGGKEKYIDAEDVAMKVNEIVPGRFSWKKYKDQVNISDVRKRLSDAKCKANYKFLTGSSKLGWRLSEAGIRFSEENISKLAGAELSREPLSYKEKQWRRSERGRLLNEAAFMKYKENNLEGITAQEAESFFRVDDYVTGETRKLKVDRIVRTFGDDSELGNAIKKIATRVRER